MQFSAESPLSFIAESQYSPYHLVWRVAIFFNGRELHQYSNYLAKNLCTVYSGESRRSVSDSSHCFFLSGKSLFKVGRSELSQPLKGQLGKKPTMHV